MVERRELGRGGEELLVEFAKWRKISVAAVADLRLLEFGGRRPPLQAWRT